MGELRAAGFKPAALISKEGKNLIQITEIMLFYRLKNF